MTWLHGLALVCLLTAACGDEPVGPRVEALLPDHGAPADLIDLVGQRLEGQAVQVHFGGQIASLRLSQPSRLRVQVPTMDPGLTVVVVTVDGRVSSPLTFTVQ